MKSYRAGGIVINDEGKIALANERIWGFPRGGVEEGEDYITAAKREVLEEVGLEEFLSIEEIGVYERYPGGITKDTPGAYPMEIHMFLFRVSGKPELNPTDKKVKEYGWFTYLEALERLPHEKDREFLDSAWEDIDIVEIVRRHVIAKYEESNKAGEMNMYETHVKYVVEYSKQLAQKLNANKEIVEIAALLHDIGRIDGSNENHHIVGAEYAQEFLRSLGYPNQKIEQVKHCIVAHRGSVSIPRESTEAECVSSADAMAHFRNVPDIFYFVYVDLGKGVEEGKKMVKEKLERSYTKMIPQAQEIVKEKYDAIMEILE